MIATPDVLEPNARGRFSRAAVRAALDRVPESARTVFMLRGIEELNTDEVARILCITPNAVKNRVHRARQALRTLLAPIVSSLRRGRS